MNAQNFLMSVGSSLVSLVMPECHGVLESSVASTVIFSQIWRAMKYVNQHEKELREMGIIDKDGNVDIEMASFAVNHGFKFPIKVGPFVFKQEDWTYIINTIRPNDIKDVEMVETDTGGLK
jgi:hypothetical protein